MVKKYKDLAILLGSVAVCYLFMSFVLGISCPLDYFFGLSCPGCGMTRAVMAALRFDFVAAFSFHPLWILLLPTAGLLLLFYIKKQQRGFYAVLWGFVTLMLIVYVYRLFFLRGDVVAFVPTDGWIARQIRRLILLFE